MARFFNWLTGKSSRTPASGHTTEAPSKPAGPDSQRRARIRAPEFGRQPEFVNLDAKASGRIENRGPDKNVLVRSQYIREDSGTHETLKILSDSIPSVPEDDGMDPYNTGRFDVSRHWDRSRN